MEYFSAFPQIIYNDIKLKNITARSNILKSIKSDITVYQNYILGDNERPEDVAFKFYGDPNLFWVILFINDIDDPYYDWPLNEKDFQIFLDSKYGSLVNIYATKYNITTDNSPLGAGVVVNEGTAFSEPVSNYTYESQINEDKRKIKILKSIYIPQLLSEMKNIF